jgi:hypothetical protein
MTGPPVHAGWSFSFQPLRFLRAAVRRLRTLTSWRYRDIAGTAVEVAPVSACDDLEAIRHKIKTVIEDGDLGKLGVADLPALGTPEMFNPVGVGHGAKYARQSPRAVGQNRPLLKSN